MKLSCEIIRDLLPLYQDGLCSPESRQAVEEHLSQCPVCAARWRLLELPQEPETEGAQPEPGAKAFRKIRRRWVLSLVAVLLIIPLLGLGAMGWNQSRGEGVCFTNLDELWLCRRFLWRVQQGDYEGAAELMNFSRTYEDIMDCLSWTVADYEMPLQEVGLDGETYMATSWFAEQYLSGEPQEAWAYIIYNDLPNVPVPLEAWQQATGAALRPDGSSEQPDSGAVYRLWKSSWGDFMVEVSTWAELIGKEPEELCAILEVIPISLYLEARPALEEQALEGYTYNQEYYSAAKDMSEEEFSSYMRQKQAKSIEEAMEGASLTKINYRGAHYVEGCWHVEFGLTAETASGESGYLNFYFIMDHGIQTIAVGYQTESKAIEKLHDGFSVRFGA